MTFLKDLGIMIVGGVGLGIVVFGNATLGISGLL